jgi:hypothetical protein
MRALMLVPMSHRNICAPLSPAVPASPAKMS